MGMSKKTDLGVGQDKPAYQVILQITLDCEAKRFFCQALPGFARDIVDVEPAFELFFRYQLL